MTQSSAFHNGTITGDAAAGRFTAPYTSAEFSDFFSILLGADAAQGYVIAGFANNLAITANSPVAMNVLVATGAAFVRGRLFESDAQETLTISSADPTNPRIDRVILEYITANQEIRLAILTGTPAATPSLPALTQNATTYQIGLGYVWVAALATTIADSNVHDARVFSTPMNSYSTLVQNTNLIRNSEYMAFSGGSGTTPPDCWVSGGAAFTYASTTKPSQMSRGRAIQITATSTTSSAGMQQTFPVTASTVYSLRTLVNVTAGDTAQIRVITNAASPNTITKIVRRTGAWVEELILYTTESDATTMTIRIMPVADTDVVQVGQVLAFPGYQTGPFRPFREFISLTRFIADASWAATAKSSGTTTLDLTSSFSGLILTDTHALLLELQANDSGSAASTTAALEVTNTNANSPTVGVKIGGVVNDRVRSQQVVIAISPSHTFDAIVTASGAGTLDATIQVNGIWV